jgi:hypothetical protein
LGKFVLEIELGNDAMQTGSDIASAIRRVADHVEEMGTAVVAFKETIRDLNGNSVGYFKVTK